MEKQAIEYITGRRTELLGYLKRRGLTYAESEDLLGEAAVDVLKYYKEDMVKSVHLAIGRQLNKFFENRGHVFAKGAPEGYEQYKEGDWIEDISYSSRAISSDPLDILIVEEGISLYPSLIEEFTSNALHQHYLTMLYVENFSSPVAQGIVGVTRANASLINKNFMKFIGEGNVGR